MEVRNPNDSAGVNWLLSLTTDELITLNGIMYGLQLAVKKEQIQGYGSMMILNIALKVSALKTAAMDMFDDFQKASVMNILDEVENGYSKPE